MSQSQKASEEVMKTICFILTAFYIKIVFSASISIRKCSFDEFSSNFSAFKVENNSDILALNFVTFSCVSEKLKEISINFTLKWHESSFQDDSEKFNRVVKNYFSDLIFKHKINSANLAIYDVESRLIKHEETNLKIILNCEDESIKSCTEAVSGVMQNFQSFDLMIFYLEAGIETSVNLGKLC